MTTKLNDLYYEGNWKSSAYMGRVFGTIILPKAVVDTPTRKMDAWLKYDAVSAFRPCINIKILIESYYNNFGNLEYKTTISNGFLHDILHGKQIVIYTVISRNSECVKGSYRSTSPYDIGNFTLLLK